VIMLTIRQAASRPDCPLTEHALRQAVKRHELPHFRSGSRVYVDFDRLLEWTAQQMDESVTRSKEMN